MKTTLSLLLLFIATIAFAHNDKPKRNAFILRLVKEDGKYYKTYVRRAKYFAKDKVLEIYASEKLNIEVTLQNDTIATMKVVKNIVYPERTIVVEFKQEKDGNKVSGMVLNVKNPFIKKLFYNACTATTTSDQWIEVSTVPVLPYLESFENWKNPIVSLCLHDWKFVE